MVETLYRETFNHMESIKIVSHRLAGTGIQNNSEDADIHLRTMIPKGEPVVLPNRESTEISTHDGDKSQSS